jgi:hypothetical protein
LRRAVRETFQVKGEDPMNNDPTSKTGGSAIQSLLFILLLGGIALGTWYAGNRYFVNTSDGIKIYPKNHFTFSDTYVDMRKMSFIELRNHPEIIGVMIRHDDLGYAPGGKALVAIDQAGESVLEAVTQFDNEYQISDTASEIGRIGIEKYDDLNQRYDIEGKAEKAGDFTREKAQQFNSWLKTQ